MEHPGRRFCFHLAETLGCFVEEIETRMSAREMFGWAAELGLRAEEQRDKELRARLGSHAEQLRKRGR